MTEEEANALDEEITNMTRAMTTNKMPLQILGEVVHEKIAASV